MCKALGIYSQPLTVSRETSELEGSTGASASGEVVDEVAGASTIES
jgi:hypothetical protein